jgi:hypothetical protein
MKCSVAGYIKRRVVLRGIVSILFDNYQGKGSTNPAGKLYLGANREVVFPSSNIYSFLSAENTKSAPKVLYDIRKYKNITQAAAACVSIDCENIPFTRNGKPLVFGKFNADGVDEQTGIHIRRHTARLNKGLCNEKERPCLPAPWELAFDITLTNNDIVTEEVLRDIFERGGLRVGIGTYRPVFGKFVVDSWAPTK